jgi:hypothetical protein
MKGITASQKMHELRAKLQGTIEPETSMKSHGDEVNKVKNMADVKPTVQ